jgi:hypothetical protein
VALNWLACGGSCSNDELLFVFAVENGHTVITQELDFDVQAAGAGTWFNAASGKLTIKARSDDGSAHCCPQHIDVVSFRWSGDKFELEKSQTVPIASK